LILCFAENLKIGNVFQAELIGAMRGIKTAHQEGWQTLWLELDSTIVVHVLNSNSQVPCNLRNNWNNCKVLLKLMNYFVFHVFREGNQCADSLANIGLSLNQFTIWHIIPSSLQVVYIRDKLGWPNY